MTTFAHGYKSLWQNQNNQKGLIPPNGTSPNFLFSKKSFIGHQYFLINRLLNTIPQEQSEVIRLHIHGEKTFQEIAEIFDIPEASVKSRYRYGIEKLRRMMDKNKLSR